MPNWASTSYRIDGEKKHLDKIYEICRAFADGECDPIEKNADRDWEGNVVVALGLQDTSKYYLRGFIQYCSIEDDTLVIEAEEAWGATDFRKALKAIFGDDIEVYYIVEEPGCEVYVTNDAEGKYFTGLFEVESCGLKNGNEWNNFDTKEEAMAFIARLLEKENITETELDAWNEENEEDERYVYLHEYTIIPN